MNELAQHAAADLEALRAASPLVHNITNYVSMDIAANTLLAVGASPAMIHAEEEVVDFVEIASALVLNIGTLSPSWVRAMHAARARARTRGIPVVLSVHDFWWLCERQFMIRPNGKYCGQDPIDIEACKGCVHDHERARRRHDYLVVAAGVADLVTYPSSFARRLCEDSGLAAGKGVVWENGTLPPGPDFAAKRAYLAWRLSPLARDRIRPLKR